MGSDVLLHSEEHMTYACPECDRGGSVTRMSSDDVNNTYRCRDCSAHFDDPNERPVKVKGANRGGGGYGEDDLPNNLADGMRERILELRGDA